MLHTLNIYKKNNSSYIFKGLRIFSIFADKYLVLLKYSNKGSPFEPPVSVSQVPIGIPGVFQRAHFFFVLWWWLSPLAGLTLRQPFCTNADHAVCALCF